VNTVRVTVRRFDPAVRSEPYEETYELPVAATTSVTHLLYEINARYAAGIAYRVSCHRGICASCRFKINGKARLGCTYEVNGGELRIEPASPDVIRDLVVASDWKGLGPPPEEG
jgi:succinate dehydrogenase/fumarate reductase-like Fe-S protein